MGGGSAPKPPSPQEQAQAQMQAGIGTSIVNQLMKTNQLTPFGRQTNTVTGYQSWTDPSSGRVYQIPQSQQTTTLSPKVQRAVNDQMDAQSGMSRQASRQVGKLGSILGRPVKAPGLGEVTGRPSFHRVDSGPRLETDYGPTDYSEDRRRVEEALMSRMAPDLARARQAREAQLSNQGIKLGTEAYDTAMGQLGQNENDARMQAILAGGGEQSRLAGLARDAAMFGNNAQQQMFNNRMGAAGFNNDAAQQGFNNRLAAVGFNNAARQGEFAMGQQARAGAVNEVGALANGGQVPMPQFSPVQNPQIPTPDMFGMANAQYQGQLANWQNQQANRQQLMGGLFGLGSAALMMSDERLKENIEPTGAEVDGIPVQSYTYKGDPETVHVGVMAQDALKKRPDAVVPMGRFLAVDYRKLGA